MIPSKACMTPSRAIIYLIADEGRLRKRKLVNQMPTNHNRESILRRIDLAAKKTVG